MLFILYHNLNSTFFACDVTLTPLKTELSSLLVLPPDKLQDTFSIIAPEKLYSFILRFTLATIFPGSSFKELSLSLIDPYSLICVSDGFEKLLIDHSPVLSDSS